MRTGAGGDVDLSAVGALLAEPARCSVLLALADGRRLPASMLASEAGVAPSTMSGHLARLLEGGLVTAHTHGRHRYYQVAGPEVGRLIEAVAQLSPAEPVRSLREGTKAYRLRLARRCYDHMGGRLAVAITQALIDHGVLAGHDGSVSFDEPGSRPASRISDPSVYRLTAEGLRDIGDSIGLRLDADGPMGVGCCVDWTEQRHHIGGPFGATLLARLTELGWIRPAPRDRSLMITDDGRRCLPDVFGLDASVLSRPANASA